MRKLDPGDNGIPDPVRELRQEQALARARVRSRRGSEAEEAVAMKNAEKNLRRKQAREAARQRKTMALDALKPDQTVYTTYKPRPSSAEVLDDIDHALRRLDDKQRRLLLLRAVDELSYLEIGQRLGVPEETVRTSLRRARQLLPAAPL